MRRAIVALIAAAALATPASAAEVQPVAPLMLRPPRVEIQPAPTGPERLPPLVTIPFQPVAGAKPPAVPVKAEPLDWGDAIRAGDVTRARELLAANPALAFGTASLGQSWLHVAAQFGREGIITLLLAAKLDVNQQEHSGGDWHNYEMPLHAAARSGFSGVVRQLLAAGADVNGRRTGVRDTPLQLALQTQPPHGIFLPLTFPGSNQPTLRYAGASIAEWVSLQNRMATNQAGRRETIRLLCAAGADLFATNAAPHQPLSPFHAACVPGRGDWLDLLLTNARPRTVRDPEGHSLIDLARRHERWEALCVLALPAAPVAPAPTGKLNPLQALVLDHAPAPRRTDGTRPEPRHYWELVAAGHAPDLFTHLGLEDAAEVKSWLRAHPGALARLRDPAGHSPLFWAVQRGAAEMAELLLQHGADPLAPEVTIGTPFQLALERGQLAVLEKMKSTAQLALRDETYPLSPLELALFQGRTNVAEWLCDLGPPPNRPSLTGGTLLHLAARTAHARVVEKLLALGADPALPDYRGRTPLHYAAAKNSAAALRALLQASAPLAATDEDGRLALHEAAARGHAAFVAKLLPSAAVIQQPDKSNRTALELAVLGGHEAAATILLATDPDLRRRGPGGVTALHLAGQTRQAGFHQSTTL